MMDDAGSGVESAPVQNISAGYSKIQRQYQKILDRWTPYMLYRWLGTAGLLALFMLRIVLSQGVSVCFIPNFLMILKLRSKVVYWSVWKQINFLLTTETTLVILIVCCMFDFFWLY